LFQKKRPLIGQIIIEKEAATPEQIVEALALQKEEGGNMGDILLRLKHLKEEPLLESLSAQWQLPYFPTLDIDEIDPSLIEKIPLAFAKRHHFLPIKRIGTHIQCATSKPLNLIALDDFHLLLKAPLDLIIVPSSAIMRSIHHIYE